MYFCLSISNIKINEAQNTVDLRGDGFQNTNLVKLNVK